MVGRQAANHGVEGLRREGQRFRRARFEDQIGEPGALRPLASLAQHRRGNVQADRLRHKRGEGHRRETAAGGHIQQLVRRPAVRMCDKPRQRIAVPRVPLGVIVRRLPVKLFLGSS